MLIRKIRTKIIGVIMPLLMLLSSCKGDDNINNNDSPNDTTGYDISKIYKPLEFSGQDWTSDESQFYYGRSKQSEHFIVLWENEFGLNPNANTVSETYRVDIDALLEVAEEAYNEYVNVLDFADVGEGVSQLDKYKMMIFLYYKTEWTSFGSGYDNIIGAIWQNPGTMQPPGATIAHEIGHAFQYQTCCDMLAYKGLTDYTTRGFRYGQGGRNSNEGEGNSFWEQCAQWQSYQLYPDEAFSSYNFAVHMANYHRHFCHENQRYASYWLQYYWANKHDYDMLGRIWRESVYPEDPIETYTRLFLDNNIETFNDELYDAAAHLATFDLDAIRNIGNNYIGQYDYRLYPLEDGSYQVAYNHCPQTTGYNIIPLNVPDNTDNDISVSFTGLSPESSLASGDPGEYTDNGKAYTTTTYNTVSSPTNAGWRFGFIALQEDGTRVYGDMHKSNSINETVNVSFTPPDNCARIWLVISSAPTVYNRCPWDEKESTDEQWPYKIKLTNTDLLGNTTLGPNATPTNLTLTYNISFPVDASAYSGTTVDIDDEGDINKIIQAFVMQRSDIVSNFLTEDAKPLEGKIAIASIQSDGSYNYNTTANGYGFWFDDDGNVIDWGENNESKIFIEFAPSEFKFTIGQYPGLCSSGEVYKVKVGFIYTLNDTEYLIRLIFNITIT